MISCPSALQASFRRVVWQRGFVRAESQLAVAAPPEHQRLLNHDLLALTVSQIEVAHRDGDVAMDLDSVLPRVVVVAHLHPALQREARILRKVRVTGDEIGECAFLRAPEGVRSESK